MNPVIIAAAITGSVPRKNDNPAVPTTPSEQFESTRLAASNAELMQVAARRTVRHGRRPATPAEARAALGVAA